MASIGSNNDRGTVGSGSPCHAVTSRFSEASLNCLPCQLVISLAVCLAIVPTVQAQQPAPRVGYVYPAGGQQGTTFQVMIGGRSLNGASNLSVSGTPSPQPLSPAAGERGRGEGAGVQAKVLDYSKPITQKEFTDLREKLQALQMEEIKDETVLKEIAEIRKKLLTFRRNANPMIAEIVTVQITIAPDAEPGEREVRLQAAAGISNPVTFHVGQFAEFNKKDANAIQESAAGKPRRNLQPGAAPPCAGDDDHAAGHCERPDLAEQRGSLPIPGTKGPATRRLRACPRLDPVPGRCRSRLVPGRRRDPRCQGQ